MCALPVAQVAVDLFDLIRYAEIVHLDIAASDSYIASDHFECGGLAGTIHPDQSKTFALVYTQGERVHRHMLLQFEALHFLIDFG